MALEEIARRAGLGIGTLYRHFPTREALLAAVYRREVEQLAAAADRLLAERPPAEALEAWLRPAGRLHGDQARHRAGAAGLARRRLGRLRRVRSAIVAAMNRLADAAIASGDIRADVTPDDLMRLMAGLSQGYDRPDWAPSARRLISVLMAGLESRAGAEHFGLPAPAEPYHVRLVPERAMPSSPAAEAARRRTFAIISHPDAGKTTLTENLLLAGGAIRAAGAVRARGEQRRTRSDWMKIERERGISVSASAMTFDHAGLMFNLLDTPGHEDFSEDTYRTLTAADAAVMVLDAAKGIEPQTLKLFEVCRLRDIPIITFINKMDREAQDPFALLDEIAAKLALDPAPLYWPAGSGSRFKGVLDLRHERFLPFRAPRRGQPAPRRPATPTPSSSISTPTSRASWRKARCWCTEAAKPFDPQSFLEGHMTPVFFGSALRHFGVDELLEGLGAYAPAAEAGRRAPRRRGDPRRAGRRRRCPASSSRSRRTWTPTTATASPSCGLTSGRFTRGMKLKVREHRPPALRQRADPVLRLRPRAGRGGLRRRRDRHPQPRRPAGRRQPLARAARCASPACRTSRRRSCGACGSRIR